jgi:hypothetical protein
MTNATNINAFASMSRPSKTPGNYPAFPESFAATLCVAGVFDLIEQPGLNFADRNLAAQFPFWSG